MGPALCAGFESAGCDGNFAIRIVPGGSMRPKIAGDCLFLYRAVDSAGDTIDFLLSQKRDLTAAKLVLRLTSSGTQQAAMGGQRGWTLRICPRDFRIEAVRRTAAALSLPTVTLFSRTTRSSRSASRRVLVSGRRKGHGERSKVTRQCT
jgi:hypothetical protein